MMVVMMIIEQAPRLAPPRQRNSVARAARPWTECSQINKVTIIMHDDHVNVIPSNKQGQYENSRDDVTPFV
jgi:hypothetical protein